MKTYFDFRTENLGIVGQLDELSNKTLGSYVKKSDKAKTASLDKARDNAFDDDKRRTHVKAAMKRLKGIRIANGKMKEAAAPKLRPDSFKTTRAQDKKNMPDGNDTKYKKPKATTSTQNSLADMRAKASNFKRKASS